jgi:hypothetical protein
LRRPDFAALVAAMQFALADEREREVGERREVATGTDRSLLRHRRPEIRVEHRAEQIRDLGARPGEAFRNDVRSQQHHRPHFAFREERANTRGVAAHEIHLERGEFVGRNRVFGKFTEACGHAVDDFVARHDSVDDGAAAIHPLDRRLGHRHRHPMLGDGAHILQREGAAIEREVRCGHWTRGLWDLWNQGTGLPAETGPIVIKLDIRFGFQRDEEGKGEITVRRLSETEDRPPVVEIALERDRL